jgi:hypothetical protein
MPRIILKDADHAKLGHLIVEAWTETRLALVNGPMTTMNSVGIDVSEAQIGKVRIVAVEDTLITRHLVIPEDPRMVSVDPQAIQNLLTQDPYYHSRLGRGLVQAGK